MKDIRGTRSEGVLIGSRRRRALSAGSGGLAKRGRSPSTATAHAVSVDVALAHGEPPHDTQQRGQRATHPQGFAAARHPGASGLSSCGKET